MDDLSKVESALQPESHNTPWPVLMLESIERKIKAKEKELECPVCLEVEALTIFCFQFSLKVFLHTVDETTKVASVPIFCCDELHLICCKCRPKVRAVILAVST